MINAITKIGAKQYTIKKGLVINIPLKNYILKNKYIKINNVLARKNKINIQLGYPLLKNVYLFGKIIGILKSKRAHCIKTKVKKNYSKKFGIRNRNFLVEIL